MVRECFCCVEFGSRLQMACKMPRVLAQEILLLKWKRKNSLSLDIIKQAEKINLNTQYMTNSTLVSRSKWNMGEI